MNNTMGNTIPTLQCKLNKIYVSEIRETYADKFLVDSLSLYPDLPPLLSKINCRFAFIADTVFYDAKNLTELKDYLFLKIDTNGFVHFSEKKNATVYTKFNDEPLKEFQETLLKIRQHKAFVYDYVNAQDPQLTNFHMIVLELPKEGLVQKMLSGEFSKMYTHNEIRHFDMNTQNILLRRDEAKRDFKEIMALKYGVDVDIIETDGELYPPMLEQDFVDVVENYYKGFFKSVSVNKKFEN